MGGQAWISVKEGCLALLPLIKKKPGEAENETVNIYVGVFLLFVPVHLYGICKLDKYHHNGWIRQFKRPVV
jgi:hypothetical protein